MDRYTGESKQYRGILAGLSAGAAAVLVCFLLVLLAWHQVGPQVGTAASVIVWAIAAAAVATAAAWIWYLVLRMRHHAAHPETLTRHAVKAEVIQAPLPEPAPVPAASPVAELPAPQHITHNHFDTAEAVRAALAAMRGEEGP